VSLNLKELSKVPKNLYKFKKSQTDLSSVLHQCQRVASESKAKSDNFLELLKNETLEGIPLNNNEDFTLGNVDIFNNIHLLPRLKYIVSLDYFRFVKLNLNRKCELWADNVKCALR